MRIDALVQIVATLAVAVTASPVTTSGHVVHERRSRAPQDWKKHSRVHPEAVIPVRIGLSQQNLHRAEEFINEVSHPESELYGQHWSAQKIVEMFAPKKESVDAVHSWLEQSGVELSRVNMSPNMAWMEFNATTNEVEQLLHTEYHLYRHTAGHTHVACDEYSLPSHLTEHIDIVTPSVHFDKRIGTQRHVRKGEHLPHKLRELNKRNLELSKRQLNAEPNAPKGIVGSASDPSNPKQGVAVLNALMTLADCDTMITPDCLRALYDMPVGSTQMGNNTLGVVEYTPQAFLQKDMDLWFKQFSPDQVGVSPSQNLIDGAIVQTTNQSFSFNGESALDLQYAMELIYPQKVSLFQVGDMVTGGSFNTFLDAIDKSYCTFEGGDSKDPNVDGQYPDTQPGGFNGPEQCGTIPSTNVISTSYSANEADLGVKYETRQCMEYMKLGLQGVSVLYSSGDFGVAGNGGQCISSTTGAYNNGSSGIFNPSFPGTCPYITSVGATQVINGSTVHSPESASERVIFSGGGFSNNFAMPAYQKDAIATYYAEHAPTFGADRFNNSKTVRGYPDVCSYPFPISIAISFSPPSKQLLLISAPSRQRRKLRCRRQQRVLPRLRHLGLLPYVRLAP